MESDPIQSGSTIIVDDGDGGQIAVNVTKQRGAILGRVTDDAGFGLKAAHVSLLTTDNATSTNQSGWFQFPDVTPGTYPLRVEHSGFRAAEAEVPVTAGNVTRLNVTMVPREDVGAGYRPHLHDYWGGQNEIVVVDADIDYHRRENGDPVFSHTGRILHTALQPVGSGCRSTNQKSVHSDATPFYFGDEAQLVIPGTARINVTIRWTATDYPGETAALVWKDPSAPTYLASPPLKSGQTHTVLVNASQWDSGHQTFSLWEFFLCVNPADPPAPSNAGKIVLGKFHVTMILSRGHEILPERPHPNFWVNGSRIEVVNDTRNWNGVLAGRDGRSWSGVFKPKPGALVPPGTHNVLARLSWAQTGQWPSAVPLSLSYMPADIHPAKRWDLSQWLVPKPVESGASFRNYELAAAPGRTDAFYQAASNWAFMWNYEGHEQDYYHVACACAHSIRLEIVAAANADN